MVYTAVSQPAAIIFQTVWTWSTAAAFALFLVAIFILWGYRSRMRSSQVLLWVAVIVLVPIAGPILWFTIGRRRHPAEVKESFPAPPNMPKLD